MHYFAAAFKLVVSQFVVANLQDDLRLHEWPGGDGGGGGTS